MKHLKVSSEGKSKLSDEKGESVEDSHSDKSSDESSDESSDSPSEYGKCYNVPSNVAEVCESKDWNELAGVNLEFATLVNE